MSEEKEIRSFCVEPVTWRSLVTLTCCDRGTLATTIAPFYITLVIYLLLLLFIATFINCN